MFKGRNEQFLFDKKGEGIDKEGDVIDHREFRCSE
jgi:hypothetical protein